MSGTEQLKAQSLFNVKGWVAVVTGGGTGLGLMAAKTFAANGAKVYITGRRLEKLKAAEMTDVDSGGSIIGIQMDATSKDSIKDTVKAIAEKEKFVNILVNNAGKSSVTYANDFPQGTPAEISAELMNTQTFDDWTSVYKINVASIYFLSVGFLPLLCAARDHGFPESGSILNVSSVSGLTKNSQDGQFAYNTSKAGTVSLTQMLAMDLKRPGLEVRVNTIAPGYFPSEMTRVDRQKEEPKEFFQNQEGYGIPLGRAGNERDYAQAVLNFAVNQYCTGSTLIVDGGWLLAHA